LGPPNSWPEQGAEVPQGTYHEPVNHGEPRPWVRMNCHPTVLPSSRRACRAALHPRAGCSIGYLRLTTSGPFAVLRRMSSAKWQHVVRDDKSHPTGPRRKCRLVAGKDGENGQRSLTSGKGLRGRPSAAIGAKALFPRRLRACALPVQPRALSRGGP
jgi:hypothetical protein